MHERACNALFAESVRRLLKPEAPEYKDQHSHFLSHDLHAIVVHRSYADHTARHQLPLSQQATR